MSDTYKLSSYDKGFITKERGKDFFVEQDIQHYKDYAAGMREKDRYLMGARQTNYRPFCIIPDVVAIELRIKYGIDIHAPEFMSDQQTKMKFAQIMRTEFPELLTSAASNLTSTSNAGIIIK